ncbi:hypothetical protein ILUMI_11796 [Ignelater luminosus]|uniref:Single domain-containing protein n=1 Tax=Ignelater luminosus TaxID=2038154 RepID=A0A8K0CVC0_IGNLU|nr:hypothetical protein ILUMI_11796 [Ignelater luminosus]
MKSPLTFIISALLLCNIAHGWTALEQTDNSKDHPGHCYSETKGVGAMELGEEKTQEGACVRVSCGQGGLIQYAGCGTVSGPEHCKVTDEDLSKPYPDCCPHIKC